MEIFGSLKYYFSALWGKSGTRTTQHGYSGHTGEDKTGPGRKMDFATAFGVYQPRAETDRQLGRGGRGEPESSYDEEIRLAPYGYQEGASSPDPSVGA